MDASQHGDVKFNLAWSRPVLPTEFLVTAVAVMGERQERSETASELDIVLKGPNGATIRVGKSQWVNTNAHSHLCHSNSVPHQKTKIRKYLHVVQAGGRTATKPEQTVLELFFENRAWSKMSPRLKHHTKFKPRLWKGPRVWFHIVEVTTSEPEAEWSYTSVLAFLGLVMALHISYFLWFLPFFMPLLHTHAWKLQHKETDKFSCGKVSMLVCEAK